MADERNIAIGVLRIAAAHGGLVAPSVRSELGVAPHAPTGPLVLRQDADAELPLAK